MADEPSNLLLEYMRRFDAKLDGVIEDVGDLKVRMTSLEERYAHVKMGLAVVQRRIDRVDQPLDRIERRLDLVEHTA